MGWDGMGWDGMGWDGRIVAGLLFINRKQTIAKCSFRLHLAMVCFY
jgi:hypothetical protein